MCYSAFFATRYYPLLLRPILVGFYFTMHAMCTTHLRNPSAVLLFSAYLALLGLSNPRIEESNPQILHRQFSVNDS
jgi:hypothetical protein